MKVLGYSGVCFIPLIRRLFNHNKAEVILYAAFLPECMEFKSVGPDCGKNVYAACLHCRHCPVGEVAAGGIAFLTYSARSAAKGDNFIIII